MAEAHDTPLGVALKGLIAGMAGALAVTGMVAAGRRVMGGGDKESAGLAGEGITAGQALSEGPGMPPNMNRVTATFVQKIATGLFGRSLSPKQQYVAGTAWHLAYGGFWGTVYSLVQSSTRVSRLLLAPIHGLIVWAVGPGWLVPRMKLMLPPTEQRPRLLAMVIAVHVAYGALVALVFHLLRNRD